MLTNAFLGAGIGDGFGPFVNANQLGPNGGQIYIDGFTGGRLPPKESIREIRINRNPFSAAYDRLVPGSPTPADR